jgi:iron(III) transport system substrate-binding protein
LITFGIYVTRNVFAAAPTASLDKAKKEAEAKGYVFVASRDEIVSRAKQEGKLRVHVSLSAETLKALAEGFTKKYPFIDANADELRGNEAYIRILHELKAGLLKGMDVTNLIFDYYGDYIPHQKQFDLLGMAEQKVLQIPSQVIDPINRNIVGVGSSIQVVAYNKKLIAPEKVPDSWEGFLRPEFAGKKFAVDLRPKDTVGLVPVWGLEKTLDYARKLAAQKPVWTRGGTRMITAVMAGEQAVFLGPNFHSVLRAKTKDPADVLAYKLPEPVPVLMAEAQSIINTSENPHAALLWLEFITSPEGQKILDKYGPHAASAFLPGTSQAEAIKGRKISVSDWQHFSKMQDYEKKVIEAFGFPKAD